MAKRLNKVRAMWERLLWRDRFCLVITAIAVICTLINVGISLLGYKWPQ